MQIARFDPSEVNEKMRRAAPIPSYVRTEARVSEKEARHFPTFVFPYFAMQSTGCCNLCWMLAIASETDSSLGLVKSLEPKSAMVDSALPFISG
jgi:hypothetical protein